MSEPSPWSEGVVQANQQLKKSILGALSETLNRDPAADLTRLLEEQSRAYVLLRSDLGESAALKQYSQSCSDQASASDDETGDDWSSMLLDNSSTIQVDHALDSRILELACTDEPRQRLSKLLSFPTEDGLSQDHFSAGLNAALRQGEILWRLYETVVVGLRADVVVKISTSLDSDGISNLEYLNTHIPSVPAPILLGSITCGRRSYVFMTRGRGETLEAMWPGLTESDKRDVQAQLCQIFQDLRRGPRNPAQATAQSSPPTRMGSFVSAVCKDTRRIQRVSAVPILDEGAFNDFLVEPPPRRSKPAGIRMLRPVMRDDHPIVMTHADLHPRNIMAEWVDNGESGQAKPGKTCKITSILDWDMAGWYPSYWEFVKAMCNAAPRGPLADWPEYLATDAIGTWPVEYALDSLIGRWLG
ncbi:hypothetical protein SPBR_01772 [Sporothrix brasiliensis 5110]|uniref:Aminoglycoside phosphotransferase domain-containing protein n=1 Tax=Sporothrix brasiliensis 5110 TaxID=1398154 RepID=A0A0C2J352_9PEZI|nr:uncharacterized protein SPBR_01772 [Sporothrix brasiliensis 5110]KIH91492.1 hypothetical protein SPBR_01772 [Sporothrix brasiliensis 5110]